MKKSASIEISGHLHDGVAAPSEPPSLAADLKLMQLATEGDRRAKRVVGQRVVRRVHRLAAMLLHGDGGAEDAAQHALVAIFESTGSFRGEAPLERWADRVAARAILADAQRRRRRWRLWADVSLDQILGREPDTTAGESVPRPLLAYLHRLAPAKRQVLVLRHVLDYSIEEIAALVDASPNTVKDRLVTGRRQVRKWIDRDRRIGVKGGEA